MHRTGRIVSRVVLFSPDYEPAIRQIRHAVFTLGQNIDTREDFNGSDTDAVHALVSVDDVFVATGRMLADGHIGRLAVLEAYRARGLGSRLLEALIEEASRRQLKRVYLGAQKQAVGFYRKNGFSEYGEPFHEVGIEHIHMEKEI